MNDQGLFFDFLSVGEAVPVLLEGKEPYRCSTSPFVPLVAFQRMDRA
jgi:hypothetical protein